MKTSPRQIFLRAASVWLLTLGLAVLAQTPAPEPAASPAPTPEKSSPVVSPAAPAAVAPAAAPLAAPLAPPAPAAKPAVDEDSEEADDEIVAPALVSAAPAGKKRPHAGGNEIVAVGHDAVLAKDHKANVVVAIFGAATSEGEVADAVVSVLGGTRVTGPVGAAVVTVLGNSHVNSKVGDSVVTVLGDLDLGPQAEVAGDVVVIGGRVTRSPQAIIHGHLNEISMGGIFSDLAWLRSWFVNCALYGRLLAFGPHLMWAWWIALGFLAAYVVLALLFGRGVGKCVETLEQRPGYSILAALLTVLLGPVVIILLILTGVGIVAVPFLAAGLFFAGFFGKAVMLAWIGRRVTRLLGLDHPALAVLVGGVIVLGLYTVPILGLVLYKLMGWIGLGVVVYTLLLGMKREKPAAPPLVPPAPGAPAAEAAAGQPALVVPAGALPPPVGSPAATLPLAGFWIRTAALLIDCILIGLIMALFHAHGKLVVLALAAYGAAMWKLRGTTIGGIVCSLKVVRLDDREIDWSTAIVRALGCLLSLAVLGFGFIWVAFDDQKQSWHDKIAGTTVVRLPKGGSLV